MQLNSSAWFAGLSVWHYQVPVNHERIPSPHETRTQKHLQFPSATLASRDKFWILHCFRSNLTSNLTGSWYKGPSYSCKVHSLSAQVCAEATFPSPEKEKSTTKTKSASCTSGKIMLPAPSVGWDHAAKKPPPGLWALSHGGLSCQATRSSRGSWRRGGETVALTEGFAVCFCFE